MKQQVQWADFAFNQDGIDHVANDWEGNDNNGVVFWHNHTANIWCQEFDDADSETAADRPILTIT